MEIFTFTTFYGWQTLVWPIEKPIFYKEASAKNNAHLTFRQVNQFYFGPQYHFITFKFFGTTPQYIQKGYNFYLDLFLVLSGHITYTELLKAECTKLLVFQKMKLF